MIEEAQNPRGRILKFGDRAYRAKVVGSSELWTCSFPKPDDPDFTINVTCNTLENLHLTMREMDRALHPSRFQDVARVFLRSFKDAFIYLARMIPDLILTLVFSSVFQMTLVDQPLDEWQSIVLFLLLFTLFRARP